jgi:hypothetical protein
MNRHLLSIAFILLSTAALVVGQLPDNTAPDVAITSPDMDSGVSAVVTVRATVSDNVGVAGVQFHVDLENHGAEDTVAPFEVEWDTTLAASGAHTLSAVARDAAGNVAASELVVVVVCGANVQPCPTVQPQPPVNRPPVANTDSLSSNSGAAVTFAAAFLLQNDTDPDGQPLTVSSVAGSSTQGGTVANNNNGSWTYTPRAGFDGTDTFGYIITDGAASSLGTVTVSVTAPPPPPPSALVAHFTFDELDATQVTDMSGRGNHGVIAGAVRVDGVSGGALQFDGVNDWVTIADAPSLDLVASFTLEAWVKPSAIGGYRTVVLKEGTGFAPYELYASSDTPVPAAFFTTTSGVRSVTGTTALVTNGWTHLAATYDGVNLRLYVNGSPRSVARSGSLRTSNGPLRIGGNQVWGGEFFAGAIDEVRVYNRALSTAEISADMNGTPPPTPVNRAPSSANDTLTTTTDSAVSFTAAFLLVNDSDPDGDPVAVTSVAATSARAGTIASTSPGSWTYTPAPGVSGADSFTYVISDGRGGSATGTVNVTVNAPAPPAPPVGGGLMLAFGFNESAGAITTNDASGNGHVGAVREAQFVPGRFGNALSFDGINDWVTVTDTTSSPLDLTNGMTIEAWVNPTTLAGWETVVMKERAGGLTYALYAHDGGTLAGGAAEPAGYNRIGADQAVRGAGTLQTGEWTHLAFTYDGQNQRLYVNGQLVRTRAQTGLNAQNNNALRIGGNNVNITTFANEFFHGMIDEVRIYNRALSLSEIQADMLTPVP